jgi:tRNA(fMet)-specific endonuclease VapC
MLDTNVVSYILRDPRGYARRRVKEFGDEGLAVSVIVAAELLFGVAKRGSAALARQIEAVLGELEVLPFEPPADREYARIRAALEGEGRPIGPNDLFIAAHALALDATLVTANVDEFERVPGLRVLKWR